MSVLDADRKDHRTMNAEQKQKQMALQAALQIASASAPISSKPLDPENAIKAKHGQPIQDTLNTVSKWNVGPYQK